MIWFKQFATTFESPKLNFYVDMLTVLFQFWVCTFVFCSCNIDIVFVNALRTNNSHSYVGRRQTRIISYKMVITTISIERLSVIRIAVFVVLNFVRCGIEDGSYNLLVLICFLSLWALHWICKLYFNVFTHCSRMGVIWRKHRTGVANIKCLVMLKILRKPGIFTTMFSGGLLNNCHRCVHLARVCVFLWTQIFAIVDLIASVFITWDFDHLRQVHQMCN